MLERSAAGADALRHWQQLVDLGDQVSVTGEVVTTHRGELSVAARAWTMAAKCLHPLPDPHSAPADLGSLERGPYLDLLVDKRSRQLVAEHTAVVAALRAGLATRGFAEVDDPLPQAVAGAGTVFEVRRAVGTDADSGGSPTPAEGVVVEAFQPYADCGVMRTLAADLVREVLAAPFVGTPSVRRTTETGLPDGSWAPVDVVDRWSVVTLYDAVSAALGDPVTPDTPGDQVRRLCDLAEVRVPTELGAGGLLQAVFEQRVVPATSLPTWFTGFPLVASSRCRAGQLDPRLAERAELVGLGTRIGTSYSALTDPIERGRRLADQSRSATECSSSPEAEDLETALEYALPPTGGLTLRVDGLVRLVNGGYVGRAAPIPAGQHGRSE